MRYWTKLLGCTSTQKPQEVKSKDGIKYSRIEDQLERNKKYTHSEQVKNAKFLAEVAGKDSPNTGTRDAVTSFFIKASEDTQERER